MIEQIGNILWWGITITIAASLINRYILRPRGIKIRNIFKKKKQWGRRYGGLT